MMILKPAIFATCALLSAATPALAQKKSCAELKLEIEQKLKFKGLHNFRLVVKAVNNVGSEEKLVGTCDGGKTKIVYQKWPS